MISSDEHLNAHELNPTGGSWGGVLDIFAGESEPRLVWTFILTFPEAQRDYGDTSVNLVIDGVPLPDSDWRHMAPRQVTCARFAEPVESSVYFFMHHRYDGVAVELVEQRGTDLLVSATLSGDVDGLGHDHLSARALLSFSRIHVTADVASDAFHARTELHRLTQVDGLVAGPSHSQGFDFRPAEAADTSGPSEREVSP